VLAALTAGAAIVAVVATAAADYLRERMVMAGVVVVGQWISHQE
jgi:hypothetical protein